MTANATRINERRARRQRWTRTTQIGGSKVVPLEVSIARLLCLRVETMQEQAINLHWKQKRKEAIKCVRTAHRPTSPGRDRRLFIQRNSVNLVAQMIARMQRARALLYQRAWFYL